MASASSRMTSLKPFLKKGEERGWLWSRLLGWCWRRGSGGMLIPSLTATSAPRDPSFPLQTSIFIAHRYHPHPPCLEGTPDSFPSAPAHFPPQKLPPTHHPSRALGQAVSVAGGCVCDEGTGSFGKRRPATYLKMVLVLAKLRMGPRTMSIPRSSEALSWRETAWIRGVDPHPCLRMHPGVGGDTPNHHPSPPHPHLPPAPWNQTPAPGRAAWRRRGWSRSCRYREDRKEEDAGADLR